MFYYNKNHKNREYYKMIEINGNVFKSKFNGKEQITLENPIYSIYIL